MQEAELAARLGYDAALLSLAALKDADNAALLEHCRAVAEVIPLVGFYLQPAVGGRVLDAAFWRASWTSSASSRSRSRRSIATARSTSHAVSRRAAAPTSRSTPGTTTPSWRTW